MDRNEPENPVNIVIAILIGIIYIAAAVLCFLCIKTDIIAKLLGELLKAKQFDEATLQALSTLYGYMILALMPSVILFVASRVPVEMTLFTRILLWIVGTLGMAGLIWLFFSISGQGEYAELLGSTAQDLYGISYLRCSTIVAAIGLFSVNFMTNFSPNFNLDNALASFMDGVWAFVTELNIGYIAYIILSFVTLPFAFLILPIAGIIIIVLMITLAALCYS